MTGYSILRIMIFCAAFTGITPFAYAVDGCDKHSIGQCCRCSNTNTAGKCNWVAPPKGNIDVPGCVCD